MPLKLLPEIPYRGADRPEKPKRHSKKLRDNIQGITHASIRRLARRGGVRRIQFAIYNEVRDVLKLRLQKILHDAVIIAEYRNRKTVMINDVIFALRKQGTPIVGFGTGWSRISDR